MRMWLAGLVVILGASAASAMPLVPAVHTDMGCPAGGTLPNVIGTQDGVSLECFPELPGPIGPQGPKGDTGATGATGAAGATGSAGATGAAGAAATVAVGTTSTLAAGSPATVTNVGTSSAAIFNFGVPQGTAGATGATGATGSTGATGPAGVVCYTASGAVTGCKQWFGTATVNASGAWSASISSAGFTNVLWSQFTSIAPANGGSVSIATGSCTTSGCSGTATGALNILGVLTLSLSNINGSVISVQVTGN